jgi:hypothetical protein
MFVVNEVMTWIEQEIEKREKHLEENKQQICHYNDGVYIMKATA